MGRDTTAGKRMAAKRSREKEAGLRRLNIALTPEVFGKLAELMKLHNCTSQAGLIELLLINNTIDLQPVIMDGVRNVVTREEGGEMIKTPSKQQQKVHKKTSSIISTTQLSLFES